MSVPPGAPAHTAAGAARLQPARQEFRMADRTEAPFPADEEPGEGHVTLINRFMVPAGRDDAFRALWAETSGHFRAQPGFLSLRLHRALADDAEFRFANVARWASLAQFRAAHAHPRFAELVADPRWREFPSRPVLYEEIVHAGPVAPEQQAAPCC
jgi:heme oxygenase (mycobilin-producing)